MCVKLLTNNFLSEKAIGKSKDVHLAVLRVLPEVIRESVDAEQHADYRKREGGKGTKGETPEELLRSIKENETAVVLTQTQAVRASSYTTRLLVRKRWCHRLRLTA